jgi:pyruvate/2-oxoglutarate dehydrogenase complex dihydrolipoamide dehydrogenase (E3) component
VPPIDGLRDIRVWDNRGATEAHETPRRLLALGGGVIGVEMAQAWRTLGAEEVTIVEAVDRLIPGEEPFAGQELRAAFEAQGIVVVTGTRMVSARRDGDTGAVSATLEDGRELTADEILIAVGRRPRTRDLGLETVGLEPGHNVDVDDSMRAAGVDGGWLYAIGDVNGRALLTHMAKYQGRVAAAGIADGDGVRAAHRAIPRIVFTDPQIAAVGMTEKQARDEGIEVGIARANVSDVAGASVTGVGVDGTAQFVIDRARNVLVGATFTGPDVGAMLHAATVAIVAETALDALRHSVPVFPSLNEVWLNAFQTYDDDTRSRAGAASDKR